LKRFVKKAMDLLTEIVEEQELLEETRQQEVGNLFLVFLPALLHPHKLY
jgi:hypothetical protein